MACTQVFHRPAIGKFTALDEPKARESLLTPTMRRSASKTSLKSMEGAAPSEKAPSASASAPAGLSLPSPASATSLASAFSPLPNMFEAAANAVLMERTPFAIDDARDEDEESDEDEEEVDDGVLDEVRLRGIVRWRSLLIESDIGGCVPGGA